MIVFQFGVIDLILSECVCFGFYHDTALTESKSTWDVIICLVMPSRVRFVCICFTFCSTSCVVFSLYSAMYVPTRIIKFSVFFLLCFFLFFYFHCNSFLSLFCCTSYLLLSRLHFFFLTVIRKIFSDAINGLMCIFWCY